MPIIPAGGIIFPIVLACASTLTARCGGDHDLIMAGMVNTPVVATLPGPKPERKPMHELAIIDTNPAPPLNRQNEKNDCNAVINYGCL